MKPWIQTVSGRVIDLVNTDPAEVVPEDIAHALSQCNRYTGHARYPYSVALHTIRCARMGLRIDRRVALGALLHDAHEAYIADVASPLKLLLPEYNKIEAAIELVVQDALAPGLSLNSRERGQVRDIDRRMLMTEAPHLLHWPPPMPWVYRAAYPAYKGAMRPWAFWERCRLWQRRTWLRMYRSLCRDCGVRSL